MKIPESPPSIAIKSIEDPSYRNLLTVALMQGQGIIYPTTETGEYHHWDKLKYLQPPFELSSQQWWFAIKLARRALYKQLPFNSKYGKSFLLATPDIVQQKLHAIDRKMGNIGFGARDSILNSQMRDTYLVQSIIEEAITSSQLEGASTTRSAAKEMLRTQRKPRSLDEKMIFNNYHAMQFIQEIKGEMLTRDMILEIHRILSKDIANQNPGSFRTLQDNIGVYDVRDGKILHDPPHADELETRIQILCQFANSTKGPFIHPIIRAILLHFMLAYDHPFVDGNGRTARALFYWSMLNQGYELMEFISISRILKKAPGQYMRAFLYTETDEMDVTYFVLHQLNVILKAIDALHDYLNNQIHEINQTEQLLRINPILYNKLNYRQMALIRHALKHPNMNYQIESHRTAHNVVYDTARTDLLELVKCGLLLKKKIKKSFIFVAPTDMKKRIEELNK